MAKFDGTHKKWGCVMTACAQPGCTGRIVDGYCDVCGSPAGPAPLVPAEATASEAAPLPDDQPDLTAARPGSGPAKPEEDGIGTPCAQPGCNGTIVDGYCDVCGGPAGAAPFVPATVSEASPVPADQPGLTAVRRVPAFPPKPKSGSLMTECTQPGCIGMIVDGYCDVCGSPAGGGPFVPAAASAASPAHVDESGSTAVPASTRAPSPVQEEMHTQRIPRVKMPRQQLSTQETTDPGAADPAAVDAQKVEREKVDPAADDTGQLNSGKELAEDEPTGAQDYRTRVEEAQLPDNVREAALCEVGKLEGTSVGSPESGDIQNWLDTILDLPWSTKSTDWIDIQGSREVEATLRRLIEPAVAAAVEEGDTSEVEAAAADVEEGHTAEVEPAAADLEKADTGPAGPQHDDTVKMPAVPAVSSGGRYQRPQFPEQQVLGPEPVQTPAKKRRFGYLVLAATALAALLLGALLFAASRERGVTAQSVPTVTATATATVSMPTSEPSDKVTHTGREESTIQLEDLAASARPFEAVRIQGTFRGGVGTFLRVQRWEGGKWLDFPLPTKTDQSGQFITQVEFGQPGRYWLRVVDPDSGVASKTFVVVIKG